MNTELVFRLLKYNKRLKTIAVLYYQSPTKCYERRKMQEKSLVTKVENNFENSNEALLTY
jgi:hypothetical protein